ncbi:hypothetical protein MOQ_006731 [Trypanosoma cruzi marinkellei]|uniref:Uncharacterized protein n=1 Tax=Trypanosoma cruzi marinkellei TaxID=85056 RepID=K2M3A4_TRYCR|nr:hypothetical protein MOQ_006731 [Trypanosoma cruzi marinkellei]
MVVIAACRVVLYVFCSLIHLAFSVATCYARSPRQCTHTALVSSRHGQASPRPSSCIVVWIQADVGVVPAVLSGGGGPVIRSPLAGQRAAGWAGHSPCGISPSRVCRWEWCPPFRGTSHAAVGEGGVDHRSEQAAGSRCKMVQQRIQYAAGAREQVMQTVTNCRVKRVRREGPFHITVTRGYASTKCADSSGNRSTCISESVTDERVCLLPRQNTDAVQRVPQHSRSQRAGTWCSHASGHHRPGLQRAPSCFARTLAAMEKPRRRA